jgi:hypothetical protein
VLAGVRSGQQFLIVLDVDHRERQHEDYQEGEEEQGKEGQEDQGGKDRDDRNSPQIRFVFSLNLGPRGLWFKHSPSVIAPGGVVFRAHLLWRNIR